ncbi:hypothetical protein GW17_00012207 [Ensete ventricosum]|nr:hypothetical protein GW17_00012207 [Ensete ventricosum]RZS10867.1 hypothetical protein BHM03_00042144 [Ensete ventricosum]
MRRSRASTLARFFSRAGRCSALESPMCRRRASALAHFFSRARRQNVSPRGEKDRGDIVTKNLSEPIRSHKDLDKGAAPLYNKAVKFYEALSKQLVHQGHVLDLFACALDQVRASRF